MPSCINYAIADLLENHSWFSRLHRSNHHQATLWPYSSATERQFCAPFNTQDRASPTVSFFTISKWNAKHEKSSVFSLKTPCVRLMNHKFCILNEILNLKDLNQKRNYIDGIKSVGRGSHRRRKVRCLPSLFHQNLSYHTP